MLLTPAFSRHSRKARRTIRIQLQQNGRQLITAAGDYFLFVTLSMTNRTIVNNAISAIIASNVVMATSWKPLKTSWQKKRDLAWETLRDVMSTLMRGTERILHTTFAYTAYRSPKTKIFLINLLFNPFRKRSFQLLTLCSIQYYFFILVLQALQHFIRKM